MKRQKSTIVGGGIAGLAAAIALEKAGHEVAVLEKASRFDHVGAGLQIGPNAVRALRQIGAWEAVEPVTFAPPSIDIRNAATGKLLVSAPLGAAFKTRFGAPYRVAHRADLHAALLRVAKSKPAITIKMGQDVDATTLTGNVIAADGIWSATRQKLFAASTVTPYPLTIWRALVAPRKIGGINMQAVNLWLHRLGHMVHYPTANHLNVVAVARDKDLKTVLNGLAAPENFTRWTGAYLEPLPRWHKDNIMLIGDAAHGTLPFLAQGAAMALEDAATLLQTTDPAAFYNLRAARTLRLHQQTLAAGRAYHLAGFGQAARDLALRTLPADNVITRNAWIYAGP